jgi:RHS repeat-associated protein
LSSTNVPGTCQWLPYVPGYPPYSVVQFTPSQPLAGPPASGFVGWWPASGTTADVQGGHNGALRGGTTYGPGLVGQAFLLNGTNAYVQVPDAAALNFNTNDFTACLWVNFNNTAGEQVLIEKWNDAGAAGWSFFKRPGGNLRLAMSNGTGGEVDVDSGALSIPNTNWIHYAVRRQAGQISIFTNGVSVASGINVANLNAATSLLFGSRGGTNYFLNGSIDEVTLYSRALSDAEITAVAGGVSDPGPVTVSVTGGALADEWGNTNPAANVSFEVYDQTGLVYFATETEPSMGATTVARSALNSPFLFQGQYFDYDTGLLYMRARFYDPYSGMFFEPDAKGYEFSVNHYAGLANNPISLRDPTGLVPTKFGTREEQAESFFNGLERGGHANADEVAIMNREYPRMAKLGFTDLEASAIVSSAYRNYMRMNQSFDLGVRSWRNPEAREISASKGFQEKIEAITGKTGADALIEFSGVTYVSDIDAGWSNINGVPAHVDQHARFTETVNDLMRDRTGVWRESRESYGMDLVEAGPQTPFPHGASLTLPQQYGMAHALSPGGTFGIEAFEHVAEKMPNGLGDCFAFKFDPRSGLYITEHVDVASQVRSHEAFFKDNLINPNSSYYDKALSSRVRDQVIRDGRAPSLWLPESFYGKGLK